MLIMIAGTGVVYIANAMVGYDWAEQVCGFYNVCDHFSPWAQPQLWTHPGDEGQRYASLLWYRDPEHLRARQHDIGGAGVIRRCARGARWREFAGLVRHVLHPRRIGSLFGRWGHGRCSLRGSAYRRSPPAVMKVCRRVGAALTAPPETPPSRRHAGRAARRQPAQCRASSAPARSAASATCLRPATPAMQDPAQTAPPAPK